MESIKQDHYYHIYNRGINSSVIFNNEDNMRYFLKLMKRHLQPKVDVLAFCILNNHFHLLVKIQSEDKLASQALSNLFNAYSKAFNIQNNRTGTLFERPFKRKQINDEDYLRNLILYIHKNPESHKMVVDFSEYEFSSYKYFISKNNSIIDNQKTYVIELFEDLFNFKYVHKSSSKEVEINNYFDEVDKGNDYKLSFKSEFYEYIQTLQDTITSKLENIDGQSKFKEDVWERPEGGGGRSRIIENDADGSGVFEKGGVNISGVHGDLPISMQEYFGVKNANFYACGLSLVLHPINPMVPTVHANWRYFEMYDKEGNIVDQWFGGGQDLTPYYLFEEDAVHFHKTCKAACDKHNPEFYSIYKKKCDDYFYNAHRNEARGIGGLFFDYCKPTENMSMQKWYDFVTEVGDSFLDSYIPILEKRKDLPYSENQRSWQEIRRGRYVEFNLVHDKGTLFGLKTNGRIESILMSLPPKVQWVYDHKPEENSEEERLIKVLENPKDWIPPNPLRRQSFEASVTQRGNTDRNEN